MEVGTVVTVIDDIDYSLSTTGTVKFIEQDDELEFIQWLYIRANDESLNTNYDPRFGNFWIIKESVNDKLIFH